MLSLIWWLLSFHPPQGTTSFMPAKSLLGFSMLKPLRLPGDRLDPGFEARTWFKGISTSYGHLTLPQPPYPRPGPMTHGDTVSRSLLPFSHVPQAPWSGGTETTLGTGTLGLLTRHSWPHLFRNDLILLSDPGWDLEIFIFLSIVHGGSGFSHGFSSTHSHPLCNIQMLRTMPASF